MNKLFLIVMLSLTFVACDKHEKSKNTMTTEQNKPVFPMDTDEDSDDINDDTRDLDTPLTPKTATNQTETVNDMTITHKIRQAVLADESLSIESKNIKIIVINGVVTLRGSVESQSEKDSIAKKASSAHGVSKVDNQLQVTENKPI